MTIQQREMDRHLSQLGCAGQYEEQTGQLNIFYQDAILCSLHSDGLITYKKEYMENEERQNRYYDVFDKSKHIAEYVNAYESAEQITVESCEGYRRFAEYNNVILAGMDGGEHGFMFTTWQQSSDKTSLSYGDYTPNYNYAKEAFATRSGFMDKERLFTNEETENLYRCIDFTRENCESLTFEQDQELGKLLERLEDAYPALKDNPPAFDEDEAPQLNM